MRNTIFSFLNCFKPQYNELVAYLTALTCTVLFFTHDEFRQALIIRPTGEGSAQASIAFIILGMISLLGFILSIIHIFTNRIKSTFEKTCMGVFIMSANGVAGMVSGIEMLPDQLSILIVFPIWNFLMGALLLYQIGLNKFEISDENASFTDIIWTTINLLIIFGISQFYFHMSWAMTFSICMFFSSIIIFYVKWIKKFFQIQKFTKQ